MGEGVGEGGGRAGVEGGVALGEVVGSGCCVSRQCVEALKCLERGRQTILPKAQQHHHTLPAPSGSISSPAPRCAGS